MIDVSKLLMNVIGVDNKPRFYMYVVCVDLGM